MREFTSGFELWTWLCGTMKYCCTIHIEKHGNNYQQVEWAIEQFGPDRLDIFAGEWQNWKCFPKPHTGERDWNYYAEDFFFNNFNDALVFKLRWDAVLVEGDAMNELKFDKRA